MNTTPKMISISEYGLNKPIWAKPYTHTGMTCFYTIEEFVDTCVEVAVNPITLTINGSILIKRNLDYRVIFTGNGPYEQELQDDISEETREKLKEKFAEINEISPRLWKLDPNVVIEPKSIMHLYEQKLASSENKLKDNLIKWLDEDLSNYTDRAIEILKSGIKTKYGVLQLKDKSND